MHVPQRSAASLESAQEPFLTSIATGLKYVSRTPDIRTLMLLALGPLTFGMSYTSLMPVVARTILHGGAALQGILLSCIGVGSLCGALTVASIRRDNGYGLPVVLGALGFATTIFCFASSQWIWLTALLGFVLGAFSVSYNTQNQALLQILAPRHLRGRIMSIFALDRGLVPLGALLAGALASHFGGANALRIMALCAIGIVVLVVVTTPQILRLKVPFHDYSGDEFGERAGSRDTPASGLAAESHT
jgi:MFS family permease